MHITTSLAGESHLFLISEDERLIIEVEKHSILYDHSHTFYKNNVKKDKAWSDVSAVMGQDGMFVLLMNVYTTLSTYNSFLTNKNNKTNCQFFQEISCCIPNCCFIIIRFKVEKKASGKYAETDDQ